MNLLPQPRRCRSRCGRHGLPGQFVDLGDEPDALAGDGADQALLLAAVAHRPAGSIDAAAHRRLRHDAPAPYTRDQVVLAHHAVAVAQEIDQQIEHLRLDRHQRLSAAQLAALDVKDIVAEVELHARPLAKDSGRSSGSLT